MSEAEEGAAGEAAGAHGEGRPAEALSAAEQGMAKYATAGQRAAARAAIATAPD